MSGDDARFRTAARAYLVYGIVYWLGGAWLYLHDVGRGSMASVGWIALGALLVIVIPFLLRRRRAWFERWLLSRRDFARILAVLLALRTVLVARVVFRSGTATVAAPWGGLVSYQAGGAVFLVVTLVTLVLVARADWAEDA
jgi:uncharacterized protein involved in cysteine biosynthesis